jgi:hypothetical protein
MRPLRWLVAALIAGLLVAAFPNAATHAALAHHPGTPYRTYTLAHAPLRLPHGRQLAGLIPHNRAARPRLCRRHENASSPSRAAYTLCSARLTRAPPR